VKVMLLFPPHWFPAMPHLALPTLAAYLRAHGAQVLQRDLNAETFECILTPGYLAQALERLRDDYGPQGSRRPPRRALPPREQLLWALAEGPRLVAEVEAAVGVLRSDAFYDGPRARAAFLTVAQSLELASLPNYPASLELTRYTPPVAVDASRSLLAAAADPVQNIFLPLFRERILADIERERPDIVGLSIASMDQLLAAATLALLIKRAGLPCHVTTGGPHITMLREALPHVPGFFDLFDSAVAFEGEVPLLRLADALSQGGGLAGVPNLIYRDGATVRATPLVAPEPLASLPPPDFDGLPLGRYLAPVPVLPLATSRGCYHGRCAFCNVGYGRPQPHRTLPAGEVVERMLALGRRYGARHIFFADEALAPHTLREVAALLEAEGAPLAWCGCARFDRALSPELLAAMARGGCRMLLFGLETASPPVMRRMAKGTDLAEMGRILRQSAAAGIWNHVFFFFGFPGETLEQAQETVNFVYAHQGAIHSGSPGAFYLERYAPAERFPARYGIRSVVRYPERDLAIGFDYEVGQGMDAEMAELVVSRLLDALPEKRFGQYYAHDVYRLLYASDLWERGSAFPPWLADEPEP